MTVHYERAGSVVVATIDRPEVHNALDAATLASLRTAYERFDADDDASVLVITGAGNRSFCAGADLNAIAAGWTPQPDEWPVLGVNVTLAKPVIAAVNGDAFGGGFLLAQSCDLCVASRGARFGITEARWGRGVDWAAPLPRMIPARLAMELLLTAQPVGAERAYEMGLVNRVCEPERVLSDAIELAETIAANAPMTVRAAKKLVYRSLLPDAPTLRAAAGGLFESVYTSAAAAEGPRAFAERRAPRWSPDTTSSPSQGDMG